MRVDGDMFEKTSRSVDGGQLGAGAQARVDPEDAAVTGRGGEQQVAQVCGEHPDRFVIGRMLGL